MNILFKKKADLQRVADQQAFLADLGQRALAGSDLSALIDGAVGHLGQYLDVDYCGCWEVLPDGQGLLLRAGTGWKEGRVGSATVKPQAPDTQAGYTLLSEVPV